MVARQLYLTSRVMMHAGFRLLCRLRRRVVKVVRVNFLLTVGLDRE